MILQTMKKKKIFKMRCFKNNALPIPYPHPTHPLTTPLAIGKALLPSKARNGAQDLQAALAAPAMPHQHQGVCKRAKVLSVLKNKSH